MSDPKKSFTSKGLKMTINITQLARTSIAVRGACPGVYFLFQDSELVYIGHGLNCFLAVAEHTGNAGKEDARAFNRWAYLQIEDENERIRLVRSLIAEHRPLHHRE